MPVPLVKAEIKTESGMVVRLEGEPYDIKRIIQFLQDREEQKARLKETEHPDKNKKIKLALKMESLTGRLMMLRDEHFFDTPRTLGEVRDKLAEKGYNYPSTLLSAILLRSVRRGLLARMYTLDGFRYRADKKHQR